jgi:tetratricopeptide (TPR) repeat protein
MDCDRIEREEVIEKYLAGRLDRAGQEEFEDHFFGCPKCREKLETARLLQEKLWEQGEAFRPPAAEPRRAAVRRRAWAYSVAAVAVIMVIASVPWWRLGGPGRPPAATIGQSSSLTMLARFDPPLYVPAALRGLADEAAERFHLGMKSYLDGRYGEAIPDLRAAAGLDPQRAGSRFFLGISLLLTGKTDEGVEELRRTISLGDSPYLEEAHFYLAKAYLRKGDSGAAKRELNWVVDRGGRLKEEAARILTQLR